MITFLDSHVELFFDTNSCDSKGEPNCGVNVSIISYKEDRGELVNQNGRNIIHLRDICVGNEATIDVGDSQNLFYVEWKGDIIAVQYYD